jgi:glucokinase
MPVPSAEAIGVDVGGTNIRAAVIRDDGTILARNHAPTPGAEGEFPDPEALAAAISACAAPLRAAHPQCKVVGIGSGGQLNPHTGHFRGINTGDPRYINYPFGERLTHLLGVPVCVDNDVKMAALAELRLGAGRGLTHVLCVAVGTGIGGALIVDGRLFHGRGGLAGHLGQFPDATTGVQIESLAGGVPLGRIARERKLIAEHETTQVLFQHARAGDLAASALIREAATALGRVLVGLTHALEPEAILMGGSLGVQPEYIEAINAALDACLMPAWRDVRARSMALGTDAGQIGAALCALERLT